MLARFCGIAQVTQRSLNHSNSGGASGQIGEECHMIDCQERPAMRIDSYKEVPKELKNIGLASRAGWLVNVAWGACIVVFGVYAHAVPVGEDGPGDGTGGGDSFECLGNTTAAFRASPTKVTVGEAVTLYWSVSPAPGCAAMTQGISGGVGSVSRNGSIVLLPTSNRSWILQGQKGTARRDLASASVEVAYPSRIVINRSTPNPAGVLLGALASTNLQQIVELCDVDIDLTGRSSIAIGNDRSLIASPACARGPRSLGPRVFVTDTRGREPLFTVQGDNVRISGFRLEGPTSGIGQADYIKEKAISIAPVAGADPIRSIEISNMEVFHWSGSGVEVLDNVESAERGRLFNTNPNAVRIRENFLHDNRHGAGFGYGVVVAAGAYALIERNVFDENRHAIAGDSRHHDALDYTGYTARENLILAGGGEHCSDGWWWAATGWRFNCWKTHQIDMHGDQNEWYSSNNFQCGTAGETMIIERNTILYTAGRAIKIRGNPADKVVVDGNVFANPDRSDAIAQNGACGWGDNITKPIDVRPNNVFGIDPTIELGSCDFFGDGQQDQFMATGVTWWAKSPVTQQWRYLNTMPQRLPELQLGDVDHDGKCDIALRSTNNYSRNGGSPWVPVGSSSPSKLPRAGAIFNLN
jgi:hypothetical protein